MISGFYCYSDIRRESEELKKYKIMQKGHARQTQIKLFM